MRQQAPELFIAIFFMDDEFYFNQQFFYYFLFLFFSPLFDVQNNFLWVLKISCNIFLLINASVGDK